MTGDENSLFNLKLIKRRDLGEQETKIINAFACGVQPATEESAAEAVRQLDSYCPPLEQYDEVGDYLWMVWEILMDIVQSPDVTGEVHDQLIVILGSLWQCAKGEVDVYGVKKRVWRDMPMLPMCMEACFNDPVDIKEDITPEAIQIWRNLNSFGARCLGTGIIGTYYQAICAMRSALEEELGMTDWRIQVAHEWIMRGGRSLLWWAQDNLGYTDITVEDRANYIEGGSLYHGPPAMCLQRWGFWMDRFEEIGTAEFGASDKIQNIALEAAQAMRIIESEMGGRKLSEYDSEN